jgi:hypothetical protein
LKFDVSSIQPNLLVEVNANIHMGICYVLRPRARILELLVVIAIIAIIADFIPDFSKATLNSVTIF